MTSDLPTTLRASWHAFLESYEPLRGDLYRYCRHLTRSPWDAEDLAQDALARAFVTLGQMGQAPPNPRARRRARCSASCRRRSAQRSS
jgi:RNA polymerase sigma-70 factor (ECF subfamily)